MRSISSWMQSNCRSEIFIAAGSGPNKQERYWFQRSDHRHQSAGHGLQGQLRVGSRDVDRDRATSAGRRSLDSCQPIPLPVAAVLLGGGL